MDFLALLTNYLHCFVIPCIEQLLFLIHGILAVCYQQSHLYFEIKFLCQKKFYLGLHFGGSTPIQIIPGPNKNMKEFTSGLL